ncbi:MAG: hypothetical protein R3305_07535 [Gammaproteobacteria bacterium]|nr:hypothetical protein [Gammaproteobacteria bacterium]
MSKARKRSREESETTELFADEDFDAEEFVDEMHEKHAHHRHEARASWRRLEELSEEKFLRAQLRDWEDWTESDDDF